MAKVLSIGEAMVELSMAENGLWRLGIAGDTLNTAWYLRKLLPDAWRVGYCSRVGMGEFSQKAVDFIDAAAIDTSTIHRDSQHEIGVYAISLKDGERSFSYWRDNSAAKHLASDPEALAAALQNTDIAYLSGITLAILSDADRERMRTALGQAKQAGTRVVFDTNLRPRLWQSTAEMCREIETMASIADLILPSFDDEQDYFGDTDPKATINRYLSRGSGQVVVKAGGNAIHYAGHEAEGVVDDLPRETPVDTTSAGDSFNAGYLAAKLQGASVDNAIRAGHALSSQVIQYRGALVEEAVAAVLK